MAGNYGPRTNEELQAIDDILPQDKKLINDTVETQVGLDDNGIFVRGVRGYLVDMLLAVEVDVHLRGDLLLRAACFCDGWTGALENAITPEVLEALEAKRISYITRQKGDKVANTEFVVKPHGILPSNQMLELWRDGVFVAGIYPHQDGIRIVSKYMDRVEQEPGEPPTVVVHLRKAP